MNKLCQDIISQNYSLQDALGAITLALGQRGVTKEERGELGELAVMYVLLTLQSRYPTITKLFHSVLLRKPNSEWTTEIDFVFVTAFGIFVIETKSFYGSTTILPNHKFQVKNQYGTTDYDVVYQNQGHCKTLYQLTYSYVKSPKVIRPIVTIFSIGDLHDTRDSVNRNLYPVMNVENLYNYINSVLQNAINSHMKPTVNLPKYITTLDKLNIQSDDNMLEHIHRIQTLGKR